MEKIGRTIKELRTAKKIKQKTLAEKCGLSQSYLSLIEKEEKEPPKETVDKICNALGIPKQILFYMSITSKDVPSDKRVVFEKFEPVLKDILNSIFLK